MAYRYQYLHDPEFVIESEEPRDDLLQWAYWLPLPESEAPAPKVDKDAPFVVFKDDEQATEPEPAAKPAAKTTRKPRTSKAVEGE